MFQIEKTRTGKPCIIYKGIKYRHYRVLKSGETSWRCLGRNCGAAIKTDVNQTTVTVCNQTHTGEHPVTMRSLQSPLHRAVASPGSPVPRTPPTAPTTACSTPSAPTVPSAPTAASVLTTASVPTTPSTHTIPTRPTIPSSLTMSTAPTTPSAYSTSCGVAMLPSPDSTPDPSSLPAPCQSQLLIENQALNQKILHLQEQIKVILDHSIESDQRLLEYTDQIFVSRSAVNVPTSPLHTKDQLCQTSDTYERHCERCPILEEEVQKMLTTIRVLEEEIKCLKEDKLASMGKANGTHPTKTSSVTLSNSYEILSEMPEEKDDYTVVTKRKRKRKEKTNKGLGGSKTKELPFKSVTITGDSHARHLAGLMKAMVDGGTNVSGICKPGAGLLNTIPDADPPPGNCVILVSGNNDVAVGRQDVIFKNMEKIILNSRKTSKVLITPLFPRYDLPADSPIQQTIRVANEYISELCERREGVKMVDIRRIDRQYFTSHGQHLRERGKRLLVGLMVEKLVSMDTEPHRRPSPAAVPRHRLPTTPPSIGGRPSNVVEKAPPALATSSATVPGPAVVLRESSATRNLQQVTYAEAVSGSPGRTATNSNCTSFLGSPPAVVGVN